MYRLLLGTVIALTLGAALAVHGRDDLRYTETFYKLAHAIRANDQPTARLALEDLEKFSRTKQDKIHFDEALLLFKALRLLLILAHQRAQQQPQFIDERLRFFERAHLRRRLL